MEKVVCIIRRPEGHNRRCEPTDEEARAIRVWTERTRICLELEDGREIYFPATNMRRLRGAHEEQLAEVQITSEGAALRWENLDEDLTIEGILAGRWRS
ncbi:MAG: DUF2442 domain-containing protein [Phycisphaerae bacterium]